MKRRSPDRNLQRKIQIPPAGLFTIGVLLVLVASVGGAKQYRKASVRSSPPIVNELANISRQQKTDADGRVKISVENSRPVAQAITMLEAQLGWAITYEDPRYVYAGDISDVTQTVRRDLHLFKPGQAPKVLVPKGGAFAFEYASGDSRKRSDPNSIVHGLLIAHEKSGNAGRFRLVSGDRIIHVVPAAIKDISGRVVPQKSVLDVTVSISEKERNGLQLLEALCAELSKSVQSRVVVGMAPYGLFLRHKDNQAAKRVIARDFLVQLLERAGSGRRLSWQLFYDPGLKMYALNIHPV